ncbi:hypothetical protein Tco_0600812 [Tanacetum coccineum]
MEALMCFYGYGTVVQRSFGIVCHEKVVRISLEGDEILRVHGEFPRRLSSRVLPGMKSSISLAPLGNAKNCVTTSRVARRSFI